MVIFVPDEQGEFPSVCLPQEVAVLECVRCLMTLLGFCVLQEDKQTNLPTLPISSTTTSTTMAATTPTPLHHHHHHNVWGVPGLYPLYDYSLLDPFGFDPFLTDPFLFEAQLGWFRSSDEKLRELQSADLERVFRSTSLQELVEEENRGWRRRRTEKKGSKSKGRRTQRREGGRRRSFVKNSGSKAKRKVSGTQLPNSNHQKRAKRRRNKEGQRRKRQRRSFGVGSMSWGDVQAWRENWGKEETGKKEDEKKGKEHEDKQRKRGEKQKRKRQRERGERPEEERRMKKMEKTRKMKRNGKSGGKVESFLSAVASKYGAALRPITSGRPGGCCSMAPSKLIN